MAAKELSGEIPPQEMPDKPLHSAEQILTHRMAFQGEFAKVDDEIKCQLKALVNNDLPTFQKLRQGEMNKEDIKYYLADTRMRKELDMEKPVNIESDYDSDMNRSMYQEFWTDLSEFKPKAKKKIGAFGGKSKSVSR